MNDQATHVSGGSRSGSMSRGLPMLALAGLMAWVVLRGSAGAMSEWPGDFEQARQNASTANRPLLVQFSSDNCPYCVRMDREVLTSKPAKASMADFERVRVDAWKDVALSGRFNIEGIPAFVVLGPEGQFVGKLEGYQSVHQFNQFLRRSVEALSRVSMR